MGKITWKDEGGGLGQTTFLAANAPMFWKYGTVPEGVEDLGWMTRGQARKIAKERGAEFEAF